MQLAQLYPPALLPPMLHRQSYAHRRLNELLSIIDKAGPDGMNIKDVRRSSRLMKYELEYLLSRYEGIIEARYSSDGRAHKIVIRRTGDVPTPSEADRAFMERAYAVSQWAGDVSLTIEDLSLRWGLEKAQVRAIINKGRLPSFRFGTRIGVYLSDVLMHEARNKILRPTNEEAHPRGQTTEGNSRAHCRIEGVAGGSDTHPEGCGSNQNQTVPY